MCSKQIVVGPLCMHAMRHIMHAAQMVSNNMDEPFPEESWTDKIRGFCQSTLMSTDLSI